MPLNDRIGWLIVGCVVGFVIGYLVRSLREVKEELDEVKHTVDSHEHALDERGSFKLPEFRNVVLLLVVGITVYAAFASQLASNNVRDQQQQVERVTACNQEYLDRTITAINERTTYSTAQAEANVELQRAQSAYLGLMLSDPPLSDDRLQAALQDYFQSVGKFIDLAGRTAEKAQTNPYPTTTELTDCLAGN